MLHEQKKLSSLRIFQPKVNEMVRRCSVSYETFDRDMKIILGRLKN